MGRQEFCVNVRPPSLFSLCPGCPAYRVIAVFLRKQKYRKRKSLRRKKLVLAFIEKSEQAICSLLRRRVRAILNFIKTYTINVENLEHLEYHFLSNDLRNGE